MSAADRLGESTAPQERTGLERCDRCNQRAKTYWVKDGLELDFCGHHTKVYEPALAGQGWAGFQ